MMGDSRPQDVFFHAVTIEELVPEHHPFRKIRRLIDVKRIRELCAPFYCPDNGRPSIPPEQLFLAWLGGYLLGCRSDRKLVMELQCNMAFRWFVGLDISSKVWDDSTFARNRSQRFEGTDIFERLFDDTVKTARRPGRLGQRPLVYRWNARACQCETQEFRAAGAESEPGAVPRDDFRQEEDGADEEAG